MNISNQISDTYTKVKTTIVQTNKLVKNTGEEIAKEVTTEGKKWQKLGKKAVDGGYKLVGKQQEMFKDTFNEVRGQWANSAERLKKIITAK